MEPLEYLKIVQRRWAVVVASVLVAMAAAWVAVPTGSPGRLSSATHTLYRQTPLSEAGVEEAAAVPVVALETMANLAGSGEIPRRVAERLAEPDPGALAEEVEFAADAEEGDGTLAITTTQADPDRAVALTDAFAAEIIRYFDEQAVAQRDRLVRDLTERVRLERERLDALEVEIDATPASRPVDLELLLTQRASLVAQHTADLSQQQRLTASGPASSGVATLQAASASPVSDGGLRPPTTPVGRIGLGGLLGLVLGVALALMLERVDTRIRTRRGAELAFGLPTISEIPRLPLSQRRQAGIPTVVTQPASVTAEAFRLLRLALQLMPRHVLQRSEGSRDDDRMVGGTPRVILVTSAGAGEGKTSTVANLAASFAEGGKLVCCLDCDIRHPRLHAYLGGDTGEGVVDFLSQDHDDPGQALSALARQTTVPGVWLVPRGSATSQPGGLVGSAGTLVAAAAELADVVLIDAGPLLAVGDPAALAPHVDAVVVVARSGRTTAEEAQRATELLARVQAPVLGVALVGVPKTGIGRGYYTTPPGQSSPGEFLRGLQRRVREERQP